MNNDLNKKKAEFLKSIMGSPKLSRVLSDALSSPIGSTKRVNSKSILSIMKKMNGMRNDGQGGPSTPYSQTNAPSHKQPKDYSNMIIFPAAPKFKVKKETPKQDGQGGPNDFSLPSFGNFKAGMTTSPFGGQETYTAPAFTPINPFAPIGKAVGAGYKAVGDVGYAVGSTAADIAKAPFAPNPNIHFSGQTSPFGVMPGSTPTVRGKYGAPPSVTYPTLSGAKPPITTPSTGIKPEEQPIAPTEKPVIPTREMAGVPTGGAQEIVIPGIPQPQTKEEEIKKLAQSAVGEGTGAAFFAQSIADEKFSGGLGKYLDELDSKLKENFKVNEIEQSLNNITSLKENFVPTMENYIRGKDDYLKNVDSLIDQTKDSMIDTDMSDPDVKKRADTYLAYLYTLKGRQNQRYGSLLNNAIADYNADVNKIQNQYNSVYKQYNDTITRKATIAQNEYNTLYSTMGDLYNNLENAPVKQLQNELLKEQLLNAHLINIQNGTKSTSINFLPEVKEYKDRILDDKGNLLSSDIINLPTIYGQLIQAGKTPAGITDTVARGIATGLANIKEENGESAALSLAKDYRNMINDLASQPGGAQYANQLSPTLARTSGSLVSSYIFNNVSNIKQSLNSLVSGGWMGKSYLEKNDKEGWVKANKSTIDENILEDIYDAGKMSQNQSDVYSKNPSLLFTKDAQGNNVYKNISDVPDEIISKNISTRLSKMWGAEPGIISASSSK